MENNTQVVILVGAARSGTKLLRDTIAYPIDVARVPYDINYIWRLGNENYPNDELPKDSIDNVGINHIYDSIMNYSSSKPFLIEKTVSNCLRIPFVESVFPNAKYIHLIRHGLDVVESAYRQWTSPPNLLYILKKATRYPFLRAPSYAFSYFKVIFGEIIYHDGKKSVWGPHYKGMKKDLENHELIEVCAIQWKSCVNKALDDFRKIPERRVFQVKYENFVENPQHFMKEVAGFLGIKHNHYSYFNYTGISKSNIGKGRKNLDEEQIKKIIPFIKGTLERLGYY